MRGHLLLIGAGVLAFAAIASGRIGVRDAMRAVDVDLLLVLFALLITVEILRASGFLDRAVAATVSLFATTRPFALALITLSGALAALVTNDVALFIVIPFTIAASRFSEFDVEDAVILEIVAANLIGCLTPLGNPQNLFVFHRSGWSAGRFVATMLPFVAAGAIALVAALFLLGPSRTLAKSRIELPPLRRPALFAGALAFALVLLEIARVMNAWPAAIVALVAGIAVLRRRMFAIDYSIVPLFFFAFIIVAAMRTFPLPHIAHTYVASIVLSQFISNVPATILLSPFAANDWRSLLYGANAGGCGTIIASLANLLGWRIYVRESGGDPKFFARLTWINVAFLVWIAAAGAVLLSA